MASYLVRTVIISALLFVLPFGGMRVICIAESDEGINSAAPTLASTSDESWEELTECERLCPLHDTDSSSSSSSDSETERCALSAGASSLMAAAGIGVIRPLVSLPPPVAVRTVYVETVRFMPDPDLPHFAPPPKSPTA